SAALVAHELERWLACDEVTPAPEHTDADPPPVPPAPSATGRAPRRFQFLLAGAGVLLLAVAAAGLGGAFRDRKPTPDPPAPVRTIAERVATGERVKLTDEKGTPTVPWVETDGHHLSSNTRDGYHWFSSNGPGLAALADEPWE